MSFIPHLAIIFFLLITPHFTQAQSVTSPHTTVSLITDKIKVTPGESFSLGVRFVLHDGWHVYWKNPGDSGAAPKLDISASPGIILGPLQWPTPERIPVGPFINYGYGNEVVLITDVTVPLHYKDPKILLEVSGEWLICKEDCVPGEGRMQQIVEVASANEVSPYRDLINIYRDELPKITTDSIQVKTSTSSVIISWKSDYHFTKPMFIPETSGVIENAALQSIIIEDGSASQLIIPRAKVKRTDSLVSGLLIDEAHPKAKKSAISFSTQLVTAGTAQSFGALIWTAVLAFIGGIILNLMPCVLPVIGIKILELVEHKNRSLKHGRAHALFFSLGIIVSLWVLYIIILAIKQTGAEIGWGFQLQEPRFVAFMILVLTLMACSFFGFLEIGATLQRFGGMARYSKGFAGSFLSGVLTTILATPCTAPFMGTSIAVALTTDILGGFLIFTGLGLGLASPYLLFISSPKLIKFIPRPGQWMNTLKELLGFPLLAAIVWLLWVLEQEANSGSVSHVLVSIVLILFGCWTIQTWGAPTRSKYLRRSASTVFVIALALGCFSALSVTAINSPPSSENEDFSNSLNWQPYRVETLDALRREGRTIYVDFTASWCITCQLNKKIVFSSQEVLDEINNQNIALVRADWTSKDAVITDALAAFGKASVPLTVIYKPNGSVRILPSLLTAGTVLKQLQNP